jgi:hypothetical protein
MCRFAGTALPQKNLYGLTPNEVLNGVIPDKHRFKTQIAATRKKRISNQSIAIIESQHTKTCLEKRRISARFISQSP